MTGPGPRLLGAAEPPLAVDGITFDFGNTLVRVERTAVRGVLLAFAEAIAERSRIRDVPAFLDAWSEEQARQFREEVPLGREVDMTQRLVRVLARVRGMPAPAEGERWDDENAGAYADPPEVEAGIEAYAAAFVERMPPIDGVGEVIARLAERGFSLGILSNWPLATVIDRFARVHGWEPHLRAVVVSQRVGRIKPDRRIFTAAEGALGIPAARLLHVGDDWEADIVGGARAGWRTAYLLDRQADSPLPSSRPDDSVRPDLVVDHLEAIEELVVRARP